jgi:hypothetical protein
MGQTPSSVADAASSGIALRERQFARIEAYYQYLHHQLDRSGQGCYRLTVLGAWASSVADHVYHFFRELCLERHRLFIDLGSGDGLVACIAGLFTQAVGIEIDQGLCATASRSIRELDLQQRVVVVCGDYLSQHIRRADCLYLYPDKPIEALETMLAGWQGTLLIAGPHFPLQSFAPLKRLTRGRDQLVAYRAVNSEQWTGVVTQGGGRAELEPV